MRTSVSLASVGVIALLAAGPALAGGSLSGSTSHGSASVTFADAVFDGPGCIEVPFDVTYTKTPTEANRISLSVRLTASQQGSNEEVAGSASSGSYEDASGTERGELFMCPSTFKDAAGPVSVVGTLTTTYYVNDSEQTVDLQPAGTLTIVKSSTTMSMPKVTKAYSWSSSSRKVGGKVTATTTSKGVIGADGEIEIAVKYPGSKKWVSGASTYPDEFGNWSTTLSKAPKGTQLRVALVDCGWCSNAQRVVRVAR